MAELRACIAEWGARQKQALGSHSLSKRLIRSTRDLLGSAPPAAGPTMSSGAGRMDRREELEAAVARVERAEELVARQRVVVQRLSSYDGARQIALDLLGMLELTQATFREHLDLVRREVEEEEKAKPRSPRLDGPASDG